MSSQKHSANLHLGAKASAYQHAKELRATQTQAEQKLWSLLRNKQLKGKKFRRQHAIADYVVDFYCHECKLAIELDGNHHNSEEAKEYDKARTTLLKEQGITVVRFWNEEVMKNIENVLERIALYL
ncbi:MAG TPA: endonuclease domain-containing protein [Flavisolibacter sp.]|nr:endonuclease domain-containing protein [Flavisolibacter sp.]